MTSPSPFDPVGSRPLRAAAEKAALWLAGFARARMPETDLEGFCLALFGMACALRVIPLEEQPAECQDETVRLLHRLTALQRPGRSGLRSYLHAHSFVTPLLAAAALSSKSTEARSFRAMCLGEWKTIAKGPEIAADPVLLWTGRHLAAAATGDHTCGGPPALQVSEIPRRTSMYLATTNQIQQIVREVAALTAFGRQAPLLADAERAYLEDALPFWTFYFVKERDLDMVCPLVRALTYAGLQSKLECAAGLAFVLRQARADGRFGMQEMSVHLQAATGPTPVDAAREIHLPLTVAALWALATCTQSASLFGGLRCT